MRSLRLRSRHGKPHNPIANAAAVATDAIHGHAPGWLWCRSNPAMKSEQAVVTGASSER